VTQVRPKVPYPKVQSWVLVTFAAGLGGAVAISSRHSSHELQAAIALAWLFGALVMDTFARRGLVNRRIMHMSPRHPDRVFQLREHSSGQSSCSRSRDPCDWSWLGSWTGHA
jgi:hypothetical protein